MASASTKSEFSGLFRYERSKGPKRLQFLIGTLRTNQDLRVLHCAFKSGDMKFSNGAVIAATTRTNGGESEGGGEALRQGDNKASTGRGGLRILGSNKS